MLAALAFVRAEPEDQLPAVAQGGPPHQQVPEDHLQVQAPVHRHGVKRVSHLLSSCLWGIRLRWRSPLRRRRLERGVWGENARRADAGCVRVDRICSLASNGAAPHARSPLGACCTTVGLLCLVPSERLSFMSGGGQVCMLPVCSCSPPPCHPSTDELLPVHEKTQQVYVACDTSMDGTRFRPTHRRPDAV